MGSQAGVRVVGATDRHGILELPRVPRGEYALHLLAEGTDVSLASPAFTVARGDLVHASVVAQ